MNHPTEDQLLLLAYGELAEPQSTEIESHVTGCQRCEATLTKLERSRVALEIALPPRRRSGSVWIPIALAAAAVLAGLLITKPGPALAPTEHWTPTTTWSATAGYVAGGKAMVEIDAQLTRLEQERYYGLPN